MRYVHTPGAARISGFIRARRNKVFLLHRHIAPIDAHLHMQRQAAMDVFEAKPVRALFHQYRLRLGGGKGHIDIKGFVFAGIEVHVEVDFFFAYMQHQNFNLGIERVKSHLPARFAIFAMHGVPGGRHGTRRGAQEHHDTKGQQAGEGVLLHAAIFPALCSPIVQILWS